MPLCINNLFDIILVMATTLRGKHAEAVVARTIRFPEELRGRISADAKRCGRSFEAQVLALLRRHFGEDVDISPPPGEVLRLAVASLAGITESERRKLTRRISEEPSD
jgi:hypothetical protein